MQELMVHLFLETYRWGSKTPAGAPDCVWCLADHPTDDSATVVMSTFEFTFNETCWLANIYASLPSLPAPLATKLLLSDSLHGRAGV